MKLSLDPRLKLLSGEESLVAAGDAHADDREKLSLSPHDESEASPLGIGLADETWVLSWAAKPFDLASACSCAQTTSSTLADGREESHGETTLGDSSAWRNERDAMVTRVGRLTVCRDCRLRQRSESRSERIASA